MRFRCPDWLRKSTQAWNSRGVGNTGLLQNKQRGLVWDPSSPEDGPETSSETEVNVFGPDGGERAGLL